MIRFALALAVLTLATTDVAFAQPSGDAPPTRPGNLRATLYDKAGGELFWERSTDDRGAVRGYEITRNGQSLGIRDALSYYDPSLQPNTPYTFTVVAIDSAGQRSAAATTTLGGGTTPPLESGPDAPAALRADIYSRTAAELFWRREPAALALRYEIRRDGQVVGTTDGVSYYTDALAAGRDYRFEVIAIDRQGRRSRPARITVRTDGGATPPSPSGPPAPAALRADIYSRTAAELFWQREPAALALRYEIRRDGRVVGTTNGVSYYTRDLAAGRDYRFEVIAIGRDGARSAASSLTVRTDGERPPTAGGPAAPQALRAERYSSSAGELFWQRAPAAERLRYEVRRDGRVLATTDGTSYFDDTLAGRRDYTYEVIAIDRQDRRSAASTVTLGATGGGGGSTPPPVLEPVQATLEPVADKTLRIGWQPSAGATFYRVLENPDGVSGFTRTGADLDASTRTLDLRVALYRRVNARYVVQACNAAGCVDSEELAVSGTLEEAVGYVKASNAEGGLDADGNTAGDAFGIAVSLSADGSTLAVGADAEDSAATGAGGNGDQGDNSAPSAGAVYVFARVNGRWRQQAYLKPSVFSSSDRRPELFGIAVSLSADGNTLAVGAPGCCGNPGRFYVFVRRGGAWLTTAALAVLGADPDVGIGASISLSGDGRTLAVGSSIRNLGTVYIYTREDDDGSWLRGADLTATRSGFVGSSANVVSLDLSDDGDTLAIGVNWESGGSRGIDGDQQDASATQSGAAFVFVRTDSGGWRQQAYLKASNADPFDGFGISIGLSADGDTLAVGASAEDSGAMGIDGDQGNSARSAGAVYVFVRTGDDWRQQAYVKAANAGSIDLFGNAVSLSGNGDTLAVGARVEDSAATGVDGDANDDSASAAGAVYVFARSGDTWRQQAYVKASNTDEGDAFGSSVALSVDGETLAVGASEESGAATGIGGDQEDDSAPGAGAVYLY